MTSPLRYVGGKTRACKKLNELCIEHFDMQSIDTLISPFFGGGSFELFINNKYDFDVIANDLFEPLYKFWSTCKDDTLKETLISMLSQHINKVDKDTFYNFRNQIIDCGDVLETSMMYFIINRCSFSGSTLSGGFSMESSKKRFTVSSIERISKLNLHQFQFSNLDFEEFINTNNHPNSLMFLDPPYYLEKNSNLYGKDGDMHRTFEHKRLFDCINKKRNVNWLMTYNNCEYIIELYKDYTIIQTDWTYGMNKTKKSSEIIIINKVDM